MLLALVLILVPAKLSVAIQQVNHGKEVVSATLLQILKYPPSPTTKMQRIKESFSLGMGEWEEWNTADEDDNFQLQPLGVSCEASMVLQPLGVSCEATMVC